LSVLKRFCPCLASQRHSKMLENARKCPKCPKYCLETTRNKVGENRFFSIFSDFLYLRGVVLSVLERFCPCLASQRHSKMLQNAPKCPKCPKYCLETTRNKVGENRFFSIFAPYFGDFLYLSGAGDALKMLTRDRFLAKCQINLIYLSEIP
jgi:rRNA maturation protein Nop10